MTQILGNIHVTRPSIKPWIGIHSGVDAEASIQILNTLDTMQEYGQTKQRPVADYPTNSETPIPAAAMLGHPPHPYVHEASHPHSHLHYW